MYISLFVATILLLSSCIFSFTQHSIQLAVIGKKNRLFSVLNNENIPSRSYYHTIRDIRKIQVEIITLTTAALLVNCMSVGAAPGSVKLSSYVLDT